VLVLPLRLDPGLPAWLVSGRDAVAAVAADVNLASQTRWRLKLNLHHLAHFKEPDSRNSADHRIPGQHFHNHSLDGLVVQSLPVAVPQDLQESEQSDRQ
jgi:hypothetical protein